MNVKLKALGLALAAAFALSAVAATAASADQVHSGSASGTTNLTGFLSGVNQLDTPGGNIKCNEFSGKTSYAGTTATTVTVSSVTYGACTAFGLTAHIDMMGCDYKLVGSGATTGVIHVECPTTGGGLKDEITVIATQGGVPLCTIDVPAQTLNGTVANVAGTPDDINLTPEANAVIDYTVTYASGEGTKCGTKGGHTNEGRYTGTITAKAYSDAAHLNQVNLTYL